MLGTVLSRLLTLTPVISTTAPEVGAFIISPILKIQNQSQLCNMACPLINNSTRQRERQTERNREQERERDYDTYLSQEYAFPHEICTYSKIKDNKKECFCYSCPAA